MIDSVIINPLLLVKLFYSLYCNMKMISYIYNYKIHEHLLQVMNIDIKIIM